MSAQPDELYFAWQVEVMLDNFIEVGITPEHIHILVGIQKHIGEWWEKLIEKYQEVKFFFYDDTRTHKRYPPSIRPHVIAKHLSRFSYLSDRAIFLHDCDIVFTRKPEFGPYVNDEIWYGSDVLSYIGEKYLHEFGDNLYDDMCKLVDLSTHLPLDKENNVIGAQVLLKKTTTLFWQKVEQDSEAIYSYLDDLEALLKRKDPAYEPVQKWTSDMWALLWNAWLFKYDTKTVSYFSFSMATDTFPKWDRHLIYHNAGVTNTIKDRLFFKADYRSSLPYSHPNLYDSQFCSAKYFDKVLQTGRTSCLKPVKIDMNKLLASCKEIFIGV